MNYDDFVGQVQSRAQLGSSGAAVKAIRATLETLGERLHPGEANHLAAQLPEEIGVYLQERNGAQSFDLDEFFDRVSEKEGEDEPVAAYHSRVVMEVVQEAVSAQQIEHVRGQLPDNYAPLFESGSEGSLTG